MFPENRSGPLRVLDRRVILSDAAYDRDAKLLRIKGAPTAKRAKSLNLSKPFQPPDPDRSTRGPSCGMLLKSRIPRPHAASTRLREVKQRHPCTIATPENYAPILPPLFAPHW